MATLFLALASLAALSEGALAFAPALALSGRSRLQPAVVHSSRSHLLPSVQLAGVARRGAMRMSNAAFEVRKACAHIYQLDALHAAWLVHIVCTSG